MHEGATSPSRASEPSSTEVEEVQATNYSSYRSKYYTGIGMLLICAAGLLAGAFLFAAVREMLVALSVAAIFGAILLYLVTPERFITASVAGSVTAVMNSNIEALVETTGVVRTPRYVPTTDGVKLFFPSVAVVSTPPTETLVSADEGSQIEDGIVLEPSAKRLVAALGDGAADDYQTLSETLGLLSSAMVGQFGLADGATIESIDDQHATVRVRGSIFDDSTRFDHPIQSFLAVGLAMRVEATVRPTMTVEDSGDLLITFRLGPAEPTTANDDSHLSP